MYERTNTQGERGPCHAVPPREGGFLALITAIVVAVSLLTLVIAVGFEGYFTRFGVMESELKEESIYKAEACVHTAILKLSQDTSYGGNEFVPVGDSVCVIESVSTPAVDKRRIQAAASSSDAFTNLEVVVDVGSAPDIDIDSWVEKKSF